MNIAKAFRAGVALAKEMGASVTAYYAIEPAPTHIYGEGYLADERLVAELERRARENAQKSVDEIAAAAKAASNGHRGLTGLLLGSATQKVLTHSKTPVLVFR